MTNHPNRSWRSRWTVDLVQRTASHKSGIAIQFDAEPGEDGGIDGQVIAGMPTLSADRATAQQQANELARLMREAGDIYMEKLRDDRN